MYRVLNRKCSSFQAKPKITSALFFSLLIVPVLMPTSGQAHRRTHSAHQRPRASTQARSTSARITKRDQTELTKRQDFVTRWQQGTGPLLMGGPGMRLLTGTVASTATTGHPTRFTSLSHIGTADKALRLNHLTTPPGALSKVAVALHGTPGGNVGTGAEHGEMGTPSYTMSELGQWIGSTHAEKPVHVMLLSCNGGTCREDRQLSPLEEAGLPRATGLDEEGRSTHPRSMAEHLAHGLSQTPSHGHYRFVAAFQGVVYITHATRPDGKTVAGKYEMLVSHPQRRTLGDTTPSALTASPPTPTSHRGAIVGDGQWLASRHVRGLPGEYQKALEELESARAFEGLHSVEADRSKIEMTHGIIHLDGETASGWSPKGKLFLDVPILDVNFSRIPIAGVSD